MVFNYKTDPKYIDRYSSITNWVRILSNKDTSRPIQSSELIEMQSMLYNFNKEGLDLIIGQGRILDGLKPLLTSRDEDVNVLVVTAGKIYLEGKVHDIPQTELEIPKIGTHIIGVLITERIITVEDNASLRDPNTGGDIWGQPGADRLVWTVSIVANNEDAYSIYRIVEGKIINLNNTSATLVEQALSTFAYDLAGNFKVSGLNIQSLGLIDKNVANITVDLDNLSSVIQERNDSISRLETNRAQITASISSIENRLKEVLGQAAQNPTSSLLTLISQLQTDLNNKKQEEIEAESLVTEERISLSRLLQNISTQEGYTKAFQLEVSPGIAYVNGRRINKSYSDILEIPKFIRTEKKLGVRFNYYGNEDIKSNLLIVTTLNKLVEVTIKLKDVYIDNTLVDINIYYSNTYIESNEQYFEELLNLLSGEIELSDKVVITSNSNLSTQLLLEYIRKYLSVEFSVNGSLLFKSGINNFSYVLEFSSSTDRWLTSNFELDPASRFNNYALGQEVKDITRLIAEREITSKPLIRNNTVDTDTISSAGISRITRVIQRDIIYTEGRDFILDTPNQIRWLTNNAEARIPPEGTTYYISYIFSELLIKDVDYELRNNEVNFILKEPVIGGSFFVDYEVYVPILGIVALSKEGTPEYFIEPFDFSANNEVNLLLASFEILNETITIRENKRNKRLKVEEINVIRERLLNLENNLNRLKLSIEGEDIDPSNINPLTLEVLGSLTSQDISIDISSSFLSLGSFRKKVNINNLGGGTIYRLLDSDVLMGMSATKVIEPYRTRVTRTYAINGNNQIQTGNLIIVPKENYQLTCEGELLSCNDLGVVSPDLDNDIRDNVQFTLSDAFLEVQELYNSGISTGDLSYIENPALALISDRNCDVSDIELKLQVRDLNPLEGGYLVYVNKRLLPLDACLGLNGTDITKSDIRANSSGVLDLVITIPFGLKGGTHLIEVSNSTKLFANTYIIHNSEALYGLNTSIYKWTDNTKLNKQDLLLLDTAQEDLPVSNWFPIYQTFISDRTKIVTGIYIRLRQIDELKDLYLDLWEAYDTPSKNLITTGKLKDISISNTGVSRSYIEFNRPAILREGQEYAFSLSSNGGYYEVYGSKIGEVDPISNTEVGDSFVDKGRLFLSNNGLSITEVPSESIAFDFEIANYPTYNQQKIPLGIYGINNNFPNIDSFVLNIRDYVPANTSITYQYSIDGGLNWSTFLPHTRVCLPLNQASNSIIMQAILSTNNLYIAPFISLEGAAITLFSRKSVGQTESPVYQSLIPFSEVLLELEEILVEGTSISVQVSTDGGITWLNSTKEVLKVLDPISNITRSLYTTVLPNKQVSYKYKLTLLSQEDSVSPLIRNIKAYVK